MDSARPASLFTRVVDEFADRVNRGESPDPDEYLARYPAAADLLRDVLPALLALRPTDPPADTDRTPPAVTPAPESVGGYVLARELGRGGMGVVYLAAHPALKRAAAVKLVRSDRADEKELIRFLAEAEAVAAVEHPHVVRVYEYGEDAGRPYLALEYLPGGSLSDRLRAGGRVAAVEAAALVGKLAHAVAAAHARGIVHRDLKPGNVLFDAADEPKVTDFGLAKLAAGGDLTQTRVVMGTPAYMPPEQAGGGSKFVGPPADVWAMGVILYECLTGVRPFAGEDSWDVLHRVQSADPAPPRRLAPGVPRDLELVCLKCLAKDPADRYPTAAELADDLDRFLAGRPVSVRPAGPLERGYKWARRNPAVSLLTAAVFLSLAGGLVAALTYAARERAANDLVTARVKQLEASNATLLAVFEGIDPDEPASRRQPLRVLLGRRLAAAGKNLDDLAGGDPLSVSRMRQQLARSLKNLGQYEAAAGQYEQLRGELTAAHGPDHDDVLSVAADLANVYRLWEKPEEAARLHGEVARVRAAKDGPGHADALVAASQHGLALMFAGEHDEAVRTLEDCNRRFAAASPPDDPHRLLAASNLALAYRRAGRPADALHLLEPLVPRMVRAFGPDGVETLRAVNNLGVIFHTLERYADAARVLGEVQPRVDRHYEDPDHPEVLNSVETLAGAYQDAGRYADAADQYERLVAAFRRTRAPDDRIRLNAFGMLGWTRIQAGQFADAEPVLREVLATRVRLDPKAWGVSNTRSLLGESLLGQKRYAEADPLLAAGYAGLKAANIPQPARPAEKIAQARERLVRLYDATNRPAEAAKLRAEK